MKLCGVFSGFIPLLWMISSLISGNLIFVIIYLFIIESFSGFIWAGFNLASGNFIYDAVSRDRMALCVAYPGVLNSLGIFFGSTFGGFIASLPTFLFSSSLLAVFLISAVFRFTSYFIMMPKIKEVREVKELKLSFVERLRRKFEFYAISNDEAKVVKPRPVG
jgi:hypothetical protein